VTRNSLSHALGDHSLELDKQSVEALMQAYNSLSTFPDVDAALTIVSKNSQLTAVVFSNGTESMVGNSVKSSPDLGPHASVFKQIVTVEEVQKFKPSPDVYRHLAEKVGKEKSREGMKEMWLISGNPFDIVGARAMGMQAAWVDRQGNGWSDGLVSGEAGTPTLMGVDLSEIVEAILKHVS
jgi:2-haloacid dehalogenase